MPRVHPFEPHKYSLELGGAKARQAAHLSWSATSRGVRRRWPPPWWNLPGSEETAPHEEGGSGPCRDAALRRLEAILFLAREPLNSRKLSQYANLADGAEARTLIRRLNQMYDESGRAFRVEEMAGGFRLMTRPKLGVWLKRLAQVPSEVRLSAPALETLAVVAYRQPVLKAAVEAIRGVNCGEVLRQLMERDLVRIVGRSEELGRPYLYGPTKRFFEVFGLRSLDDLPEIPAQRQPPPETCDISPTPSSSQPHKENSAVRIQQMTAEYARAAWPDADLPPAIGPVAEDDDFDEEELEEEEIDDDDMDEDEYDDDLDEDFDEEEDLDEEEEWDYDDDEGELDEEWEEVDDGDELDEEEDDEWDEEDDDAEEWEDD